MRSHRRRHVPPERAPPAHCGRRSHGPAPAGYRPGRWRRGATSYELRRRDDALGDLAHLLVLVACFEVDALESLVLKEPVALHEDSLGAFDDLAGLQRLLEVGYLLALALDLLEAAHSHLQGGREILLAERLHEVG